MERNCTVIMPAQFLQVLRHDCERLLARLEKFENEYLAAGGAGYSLSKRQQLELQSLVHQIQRSGLHLSWEIDALQDRASLAKRVNEVMQAQRRQA